MKRLNLNSTRIFCVLMDSLVDNYRKIENKPYMPLSMEFIGTAQLKPYGLAMLYSLCHYYKQNGDLMQDPEMCFAVVDNRERSQDYTAVYVVPYMYQQANLGIYQESIQIEEGCFFGSFDGRQQAQHAAFADTWLDNIEQQGFLLHLAEQPPKK
jgi:hypothetical protein